MIRMLIDSFFVACQGVRVPMRTDVGWIVPKQSRRSEFVVVTTTMDELLVCRQLAECPARM